MCDPRSITWRRKWQSTPAPLPGKSHGQRSLIGYSPWGRKESDTTEQLYFHFQANYLPSLAFRFFIGNTRMTTYRSQSCHEECIFNSTDRKMQQQVWDSVANLPFPHKRTWVKAGLGTSSSSCTSKVLTLAFPDSMFIWRFELHR